MRKGEILGVAGMDGSGRTELAELLFGVKRADSGEILIRGKPVRMKTPLSAIQHNMCFITEDRQVQGLFLKHTLLRNIPIASYVRTRTPFALPSEDVKVSEKYVGELKIRTSSLLQLVMQLSGGNQQKVVLESSSSSTSRHGGSTSGPRRKSTGSWWSFSGRESRSS